MKQLPANQFLHDLKHGRSNFIGVQVDGKVELGKAIRLPRHLRLQCQFNNDFWLHDQDLQSLDLDGSTFNGKMSLGRIDVDLLSALHVSFIGMSSIQNSRTAVLDLSNSIFQTKLLIRKVTGMGLYLDEVHSPESILNNIDFDLISVENAQLGRRKSLTLGEMITK